MKLHYAKIKGVLEKYGHTAIDCNSNGSIPNAELSEGANISNSNNMDLFVSLYMNASDGQGNGIEALVRSTSSKSYNYAANLCDNFSALGFLSYFGGVKCYVRDNNKGVWIETKYLYIGKVFDKSTKKYTIIV